MSIFARKYNAPFLFICAADGFDVLIPTDWKHLCFAARQNSFCGVFFPRCVFLNCQKQFRLFRQHFIHWQFIHLYEWSYNHTAVLTLNHMKKLTDIKSDSFSVITRSVWYYIRHFSIPVYECVHLTHNISTVSLLMPLFSGHLSKILISLHDMWKISARTFAGFISNHH